MAIPYPNALNCTTQAISWMCFQLPLKVVKLKPIQTLFTPVFTIAHLWSHWQKVILTADVNTTRDAVTSKLFLIHLKCFHLQRLMKIWRKRRYLSRISAASYKVLLVPCCQHVWNTKVPKENLSSLCQCPSLVAVLLCTRVYA